MPFQHKPRALTGAATKRDNALGREAALRATNKVRTPPPSAPENVLFELARIHPPPAIDVDVLT